MFVPRKLYVHLSRSASTFRQPLPQFQIKLLELIDHITFVFYKRISFEVYSNGKEQTATNNK